MLLVQLRGTSRLTHRYWSHRTVDSMTRALCRLSDAPVLLDSLTEALKGLTETLATSPSRVRSTVDNDGRTVRCAPRRTLVGSGVFHCRLLVAVGNRITGSRHAGIGRHARSGMHRSVSHSGRGRVRGGLSRTSRRDHGGRRCHRVSARRAAHHGQSRCRDNDPPRVRLFAGQVRRAAAVVIRWGRTNVTLGVRLLELRRTLWTAGRGAADHAAGTKPQRLFGDRSVRRPRQPTRPLCRRAREPGWARR
jgi:hypothetical protein